MNRKNMLARALSEARSDLVEAGEEFTEQDVANGAADLLAEWECEEAEERAERAEIYGEPDDTSCIQSADIWGTGEGQYHGVIA